MTLRALIADDEPLARARLTRFLSAEGDVEVVAECADGAQAVEAIRKETPDVVFLDIEMPELDGFEVLATIAPPMPAVVFVTAYDQHAIRAFEAHALDYVLKPVERERLRRSVERAREHIDRDDLARRIVALQRELRPAPEYLDRIAVRSRGRVTLIGAADITWIEAAGNYASVHTAAGHHLLRETLNNLEARLDPQRFVRIHRSAIVATSAVREVRSTAGGDAVVILHGGSKLTLSRTYRDRAAALLGLRKS
jgi:two-component system LytT family response regulator